MATRQAIAPLDVTLYMKVLHLLNGRPRFGTRSRRMHFDSYSVAAEIEERLRHWGYDPRDPALQPPED